MFIHLSFFRKMAELSFVLSADQLKELLTVKNGKRTLKGYTQLFSSEMARLIDQREQNFRFSGGIIFSGASNQKIYPHCNHEGSNQKSVLTFSFEKFDDDNELKINWIVKCEACVGVDQSLFKLINEMRNWRSGLNEKSNFSKLANSVPTIENLLEDIKDKVKSIQDSAKTRDDTPILVNDTTIADSAEDPTNAEPELVTSDSSVEELSDSEPECVDSESSVEKTPPSSAPQIDPSQRIGRRARKKEMRHE
jgi:hypothetical protein